VGIITHCLVPVGNLPGHATQTFDLPFPAAEHESKLQCRGCEEVELFELSVITAKSSFNVSRALEEW